MQQHASVSGLFINFTASGKHYEWQLHDGRGQWLRIENDSVIETHYCQPGAKEMIINASLGQINIDFDNIGNQVQRLTFLPQGQAEDFGWYFRDKLWCEYGTQGTSSGVSSVSSQDVELQYNLNPQGTFNFSVGSSAYSIDFSDMTQTNHATSGVRYVRRRPKFGSIVSVNRSVSLASSPLRSGHIWEFMGEEGIWMEYKAKAGSYDSAAIETHFQRNPRGQLNFQIRTFPYTLDFARMCQTNISIGTVRAVRRTPMNGNEQNNSAGTQPRWQFQDVDGTWKDYVTTRRSCSVSSQDIEAEYQQNPTGTFNFTAGRFTYELNFAAMTQKNLSTQTTRSIQRIIQ
ncbi:uncharacterized protein FYW47_018372 [Aplochiton taeniatus]